ncbi:MAG: DUF4214 domain-containing protein [Massilia sp.]
MATVSDIEKTTPSGLNHIDALLDKGPDWNYLTPVGNTLQYTFSVTSGNETGQSGQEAFTLAQQLCVRGAFDYISRLTGIQFAETANGAAAQLHFANIDITDPIVTGLCSWTHSYTYTTDNQLVSYDANAYVYLDNVQWYAQNRDLSVGRDGYETLLHELGHALGLKHPFREADDPASTIVLPQSQDNTTNTLMSYTHIGGPRAAFSQYDVAALNWLYGGDGLGGALGVNSVTGARYITGTNGADTLMGTQFDDTLEGDGGNDMINGGNGTDTVVFRNARSTYTINQLPDGDLEVAGTTDGVDHLTSIEVLSFADGSFQRAQVGSDTTAPAAPTLKVAKNAAGYSLGNTPLVSGQAEANATVKLYKGDVLLGTTQADAKGLWTMTTIKLADGLNYSVFAKATDAAGNTSVASAVDTFNVDATAPVIPTAAVLAPDGNNQPLFSGAGEAGTVIHLIRAGDFIEIGRTTVGVDGKWVLDSAPLPNGKYDVSVVSADQADNATTAAARLSFTVASTANLAGGAANDQLRPGAGNSAVDGQGGIDTVNYQGPRSNFTVTKDVWGYSVVDKVGDNGHDSLINVERIHFGDDSWLALDVNGVAGQAYRMYQAAFDRTPDLAGLGYWISRMDNGAKLNQVAAEFINQPEFDALYGKNPSSADFINHLYNNVLHRAPDAAGFNYWMDSLDVQHATRDYVLGFFTESPENQALVIGSIQNGFAFAPWQG